MWVLCREPVLPLLQVIPGGKPLHMDHGWAGLKVGLFLVISGVGKKKKKKNSNAVMH